MRESDGGKDSLVVKLALSWCRNFFVVFGIMIDCELFTHVYQVIVCT